MLSYNLQTMRSDAENILMIEISNRKNQDEPADSFLEEIHIGLAELVFFGFGDQIAQGQPRK
jgi:hypothetical protein